MTVVQQFGTLIAGRTRNAVLQDNEAACQNNQA
jgi:hypothetical protein